MMTLKEINNTPYILLLATFIFLLSEKQDNASINSRQESHPKEEQKVLVVEGENVINSESGFWSGFGIPRSEPVKLFFRNNTIISSNSSGYMLQAGDENPSVYNNKLDGEIISGNRFIWQGTDDKSITHGLFTGYNINALIKYNYLEGTPMGIIRKSDGMSNTSGGIAYNIINDPSKVAVVVKGMNNVNIYNNTFYSERTPFQTWRPLVHIYSNDSPSAPSRGAKIFNNIFYTKHRIYNITIEDKCLEGFECDYNLYYCEEGEPVFRVGEKEMTFSQWRELGYDLHSQILNPEFNNFREFVPSARLDTGKDLGKEWETGLSVKAVWGVEDPEKADQNGKWQVGARIYAEEKGTEYFVAANGNDSNPGTISQPFATWQKGFSAANPGDTVFIRGGSYYPGSENVINVFGSDFFCGVCISRKKGSAGKLITIKAYPGEKPVLDCSKINIPGYKAGIILSDCSYWHLKGLKVIKANQMQGFGAFGIYLISCSNNRLEQIISAHHGGSGIRIGYESEGNLLLNCDAFNCYDSLTIYGNNPYHGGHADGIEVSDIFERNGNERINRLIGCRSWNNSDDGYDFFKCEGIIIMDHCWAWNNGYDDGDGSGFKLGTTKGTPEKLSQRILINCKAFSNSGIGFDQNDANVRMKLENCVSFTNGTYGYNFQWNAVNDTLLNNISYKNGKNDTFMSSQFQEGNSWQKSSKITDSYFLSVSPHGVAGARQKNGSLPKIRFLVPKKSP